MNRPKYPKPSKDLSFEEFMCAESKYFQDIEKYCDELEKALEEEKGKIRFKVTFPEGKIEEIREQCVAYIERETNKYVKALDKACDVLANELNACCVPETDLMKDCGVDCKKCWKEYLLKDE